MHAGQVLDHPDDAALRDVDFDHLTGAEVGDEQVLVIVRCRFGPSPGRTVATGSPSAS